MTSLAKWTVGLALGAMVLMSINEGVAQDLTEADRASFIAGTVDGCMRRYGTEGTEVIPRPLFEQYCRCYANGLVRAASNVSANAIRSLWGHSRRIDTLAT
jgi:hypothetical protein